MLLCREEGIALCHRQAGMGLISPEHNSLHGSQQDRGEVAQTTALQHKIHLNTSCLVPEVLL